MYFYSSLNGFEIYIYIYILKMINYSFIFIYNKYWLSIYIWTKLLRVSVLAKNRKTLSISGRNLEHSYKDAPQDVQYVKKYSQRKLVRVRYRVVQIFPEHLSKVTSIYCCEFGGNWKCQKHLNKCISDGVFQTPYYDVQKHFC